MVAFGPFRRRSALIATVAFLAGAAAAHGADAGGHPHRGAAQPALVVDASACGYSCVPAVVSPPPEGPDCHWEHLRVPADRFTVIVKRVRVCF